MVRRLCILCLLVTLWPGLAMAQSAALMDADKQFQTLYQQGRYAEAEPFVRKALELSEKEFGLDHPGTAAILNNLARLYRAQGRHAEAESLYKRALAIMEKLLGPDAARFLGEGTAAPRRRLTPGDMFRDCTDCPEMAVIPAGTFTMGSPASEEGRVDDEGPQHGVTIGRPFAIGRDEVTFAEWHACVQAKGCSYLPGDQGWGHGDRPVIDVSWEDTQAYVRWLSGKTGHEYRLPSESEWEYAARAGTTTAFHFGDRVLPRQANYAGNYSYHGGPTGVFRERTVAVGSPPSNEFGLQEVHGNVREWVEDCWNGNYSGAPSDGSAWTTGSCSLRVVRGGSWIDPPGDVRSAVRSRNGTGNRNMITGFRVARTLVEQFRDEVSILTRTRQIIISEGGQRITVSSILGELRKAENVDDVWTKVKNTLWQLRRLNNLPVLAGTEIVIKFDDQSCGWKGDFNTYYCPCRRADINRLEIGDKCIGTLVGGSGDRWDQEQIYSQILRSVDGYFLKDDELILLQDEKEVLHFAPRCRPCATFGSCVGCPDTRARIANLEELRNLHLITEEEFASNREQILSESADTASIAAKLYWANKLLRQKQITSERLRAWRARLLARVSPDTMGISGGLVLLKKLLQTQLITKEEFARKRQEMLAAL